MDTTSADTVQIDGAKVARLRMRLKLNQAALASIAKPVSRSWISVIEKRSRVQVSRGLAERLASALGTTVAQLMPPKPKTGFRFGAGFPVVQAKIRAQLLHDVMREIEEISLGLEALRGRVEEIREAVEELLRSEGKTE